jgi:hypothetical protein
MSEINKLNVKIQQTDDRITFDLSGAINETFGPFVVTLSKQLPRLSYLHFNLDGITLINSSGTREWTKLIGNAQHIEVTVSHCPKVFIDQVNTVEGFLTKNCRILSFYVPYFNEDTNVEKNLLFENGKNFNESEIKINQSIVENDVRYNLDVIESTYFRFMKKFT